MKQLIDISADLVKTGDENKDIALHFAEK